MTRIVGLFNAIGDSILRFNCPGCKDVHDVKIGPGGWGYNGNPDSPTFTPSLLVKCGHYAQDRETPTPTDCWCTYNAENPTEPAPFKCYRCHSHITDGQIAFLNDCTHEFAGKTVPIPPYQ